MKNSYPTEIIPELDAFTRRNKSYHQLSTHFLFFLLLFSASLSTSQAFMTAKRKLELRHLVKQTWYHGFGNYMKHAFPKDELQPIACRGLGPNHKDSGDHGRNDVLGDFSLTLIDSIDTFIALQDYENFDLAVRTIIKTIPHFNLNSKVQVFETTIRVLGGLLSGHLFAKNPNQFFSNTTSQLHHHHDNNSEINILQDYDDQLLFLAKDLADRMLPAFEASRTGIPYARINLMYGVIPGESTETCTAGAGSLLLEFATLSRLTGDSKYENFAKKAFYALWNRRSQINLFGNTIDLQTGHWNYGIATIGAGIDSFYEYILKSHILLQDDSFLDLWNQAYKSVMTYMKSSDGFLYRGVNMQTGAVATTTIDSLAAFWPGLQVLAGDIEGAVKSHMVYANLWARYSGIPEVFDIHKRQAVALSYPLRPEFIESNYFLYRATKDEYYLEVAERVITDLVNRTWVDCGLASIDNLLTGKLDDRMHSFMLSETLKYLYLTFDEENPINHSDEPFIFTTEGHILYIPNAQDLPENQRSSSNQDWSERESLDSDQLIKEEPKVEKFQDKSQVIKNKNKPSSSPPPPTCQVFSTSMAMKSSSPLKLSVTGRTDFEYAKMITGSQTSPMNINSNLNKSQNLSSSDSHVNHDPVGYGNSWFEFGLCEVPSVDENLIELIFSRSEKDVDRESMTDKVSFFQVPVKYDQSQDQSTSTGGEQPDQYERNQSFALVKNLTGLTFSLRKLHDRDSYEIVNIGMYSLPARTTVILSDPYAVKVLQPQKESEKLSERDRNHLAAVRVSSEDSSGIAGRKKSQVIDRLVMIATFGPDVRIAGSSDLSVGNPPIELVQLSPSNEFGCLPIQSSMEGKVVLIKRGECTFADKLQNSVLAGAKGVIICNEDESLIIPTSDRIQARDRSEDLLNKDDTKKNQEINQELQDKLKSIPLLFTNFESSQMFKNSLDQNLKSFVQILENPLELLDNLSNSDPLDANYQDLDDLAEQIPTSSSGNHHRQKSHPVIVINGYPLSNLILQSG